MTDRTCDSCMEAPPILKLSVTDMNGVLLDSINLCRACFNDAKCKNVLFLGETKKEGA